jgi:hypothetical protein
VALNLRWSLLNFDSMVILKATRHLERLQSL